MMARSQHRQQLGMTRLLQTGRLQRVLGDRIGDQRQALARRHRGGRLHDRIEDGGIARSLAGGRGQHRQRVGEGGHSLTRRADHRQRHIQMQGAGARGECIAVAEHDEGGEATPSTLQPGGQRDVRADSGGIAQRQGERQGRGACLGRAGRAG